MEHASRTLMHRLIIPSVLCLCHAVLAQTITWADHTWKVTSGGMAGVARGSPENVSVDEKGYLHLRIEHVTGIGPQPSCLRPNDSASAFTSG